MSMPRIRLTFWRVVFAVIIALGAFGIIARLTQGLGATTHLSDQFPWGLWIGFDVLVGVGLAAGGFCIAATVHVFHIKSYEPIARPAILTAFLGYILVVVALVLDIGRPWAIWHPLVMWNPRSVMFEVAWCVMAYSTVLAIEFSPVVLERFKLTRTLRLVKTISLPAVVLGVLLSMMHQSSLGTLFVIAPERLHPLWYTPLLPVFFFLTAVAAGLAMTIIESCLSFRAFGRELEEPQLRGLARAAVVVLAVYGVWKIIDLNGRGSLGYVFALTRESVLFWGEMVLGIFLPLVLFASRRIRHHRQGLFFAAVLTVIGFIVGRLNVAITGMAASSGTDYFPSWQELAVTASFVAAGFGAFVMAVRYFPVFPEHAQAHGVAKATSHAEDHVTARPERRRLIPLKELPSASGFGLAMLWILLAGAFALVLLADSRASNALKPPEPDTAVTAAAASDLRVPADYVFKGATQSPGAVTFSHENHIGATAPRCDTCHATGFSMLSSGKPLIGTVTMQRIRKRELCGSCHDGKQAFGVDDNCETCHQKP